MNSNTNPAKIDATPSGSLWQPNPYVIAKRMADQLVVLHLQSNRFYELNHTAARFWELLEQGQDLQGIQAQMLREFEVDEAELAGEIKNILALMQAEDLVSARD